MSVKSRESIDTLRDALVDDDMGEGSGIDADLLDSRNSTAFCFAEPTVGDANLLTQAGLYTFIAGSMTNVPKPTLGGSLSNTGKGQVVIFEDNTMYFRSILTGAWGQLGTMVFDGSILTINL